MSSGHNSIQNDTIRAVHNKLLRKPFDKNKIPGFFSRNIAEKTRTFHSSFPQYRATPLIRLKSLAAKLNVGQILIKDESFRFGLNAFKVLGATYAIGRLLARKLHVDIGQIDYYFLKSKDTVKKTGILTFATASDGNHGRGVAWTATQFGHKAVVFLPKGTVKSRIEAIRQTGAETIITEYDYDDTVQHAKEAANKNGWVLVQDTAFEDYTEIPLWIMQGYTTMIAEATTQMQDLNIEKPTHVFLQAGVGSMSAAVLGFLVNVYGEKYPLTIIIEPHQAACFFRSIKIGDGHPHPADGSLKTMMAGLSCGVPSLIAWDIIKDFADTFISCSDCIAAEGMRIFARPHGNDNKIISGESGAVGIGLLAEIMMNNEHINLRENLNLNKDSIVLLFNTEGDTDPQNYRKIVAQ